MKSCITQLGISVWAMFFALSASGQQIALRGVVSIQNSEFETGIRQPVINAQVTDLSRHATPAITNRDGAFELKFVNFEVGTPVSISVTKRGYEVINLGALHAVLGDTSELKIYMAKPEKVADFRAKFYNAERTTIVRSLNSKMSQLTDRLNQARASGRIDSILIHELEDSLVFFRHRYIAADSQARDLAEYYSLINIDDADSIYKVAFGYLQTGKEDSAIFLLNSKNLLFDAKKLQDERLENARRDSAFKAKVAITVPLLLLKATTLENHLLYDSAEYYLKTAIETDTFNIQSIIQYAMFLDLTDKRASAVSYYLAALRQDSDSLYSLSLLIHLGRAYYRMNKMDDASNALLKAIHLAILYPQDLSTESERDIINAYIDLGAISRRLGNYKDANYYLFTSLRIMDSVPIADNSGEYRAATLNNLGELYIDERLYSAADSVLEEAFARESSLIRVDSIAGTYAKASTLHNLAFSNEYTGRHDKANNFFLEEYNLIYPKFLRDPIVWASEIEPIYNDWANNLVKSNEPVTADSLLHEALRLVNLLVKKDSASFIYMKASVEMDIGGNYQSVGRFLDAEAPTLDAYLITKRLAAISPQLYRRHLAHLANNLGDVYCGQLKFDSALMYFRISMTIIQQSNYGSLKDRDDDINRLKQSVQACRGKRAFLGYLFSFLSIHI
jgi:tetratricopeptide (TPR) repeat protein